LALRFKITRHKLPQQKMAIANNQQMVRANRLLSNKATRQKLDGQEHVVVPVTLIVEGLLNGIFYNAAEVAKFAQAWNGVPVPVNHPQENGAFVSANQPQFVESVNIGTIFNAKFEENKLTAEAWLNVDKANRLGFSNIIAHFDSGQTMEVSTGLFCDAFQTSGVWANTPYNFEARNIRPDHLALLPDTIGACSVVDGCGAMRTNEKDDGLKITGNHLTANQLSFDQIRQSVGAEIRKGLSSNEYAYIVAIYDDFAIYEIDDKGEYLKVAYSIDAVSGAVTLGATVAVTKRISYDPTISTNNTSKDMCDNKKIEEVNAPTLSAHEMAEYQTLKANEAKRVSALRESVGKIHPALTPEILANMSTAALEALNVAPVVESVVAPVADMSARGGVSVNAVQPKPYVRPSVVTGDWN
jgi:hypothetical protein